MLGIIIPTDSYFSDKYGWYFSTTSIGMILPWTVGKTCELPRLSAGPRSPWVIYSHDIPMRDISVIYDADIPLNQHFSCLNSWSNTSTSWVQILTSWGIPMISKLTFPLNQSFYPCKCSVQAHHSHFSFPLFSWMRHAMHHAISPSPGRWHGWHRRAPEVLCAKSCDGRLGQKNVDLSWW